MSVGYQTPPRQQALSTELRNLINERNILTTRTRMKVLSALEDMSRMSQEEKQKELRAKAIQEILTSEASYLLQLELLMKYFMEPLKNNCLITPEEWTTLFAHIDTIYSVNGALLDELKEHSENVAAAFLKLAPYFKLYSLYAYEYKHIVAVLQEAPKKNCALASFIKNQESRPEVGTKLTALLIVPIQRIPRYRLLLREVLARTSPYQQDYYTLQNSLQEVERTAEHINDLVQEQENTEKIVQFQRSLQNGRPGIVTPGRKLLRQGILMKVSSDGRKSFPRYFALFSDMVMYCTVRGGYLPSEANSLICRCILPLKKCSVQPVLSEGVLRISCADETIIVYSACVDDTRRWMLALQDAMKKYLSHCQTLRKDSSSRRPLRHKDLAALPPDALGQHVTLPPRCRKRRLVADQSGSSSAWKRSRRSQAESSVCSRRPTGRLALFGANLRRLGNVNCRADATDSSETPRRKWNQSAVPMRSSLRSADRRTRKVQHIKIVTPGGSVDCRQDGKANASPLNNASPVGSSTEGRTDANQGGGGDQASSDVGGAATAATAATAGPWAALGKFVLGVQRSFQHTLRRSLFRFMPEIELHGDTLNPSFNHRRKKD